MRMPLALLPRLGIVENEFLYRFRKARLARFALLRFLLRVEEHFFPLVVVRAAVENLILGRGMFFFSRDFVKRFRLAIQVMRDALANDLADFSALMANVVIRR